MKRVIILGRGGSGKSTLAEPLGAIELYKECTAAELGITD